MNGGQCILHVSLFGSAYSEDAAYGEFFNPRFTKRQVRQTGIQSKNSFRIYLSNIHQVRAYHGGIQ